MTLRTEGEYTYGDSQADIRDGLLDYSRANRYPTAHYANAVCQCGGHLFHLSIDETEGVAVRRCQQCGREHAIGDSGDYLVDAQLEECGCLCGARDFEITVGVALYGGSEDVRWLYIGCRCPVCGLTGCYGDWKNEYPDYKGLLAKV